VTTAGLVIDASVVSAWCFPDEQTDYTNAILHAGSVIASRLGLASPGSAQFEAETQWRHPGVLPESATRYVVREMSALLPGAVERLRTLQITPVDIAVPANVAQYAREASRCYLYGLFTAALVLCRSCIEAAVKDRLVRNGLRKCLDAIRDHRLEGMLELALTQNILDDLTFAMADGVRKKANDAVHGLIPTTADCQARLEQTRAVLHHLYG